MKRRLNVFLPLPDDVAHGVLERFLDDPATWLESARHAGPDTWRVTLSGAGFHREVDCRIGPAWRTGNSAWRSIVWDPTGTAGDLVPIERLLPRLVGEIGVAREAQLVSLVLSGGYELPAAFVGMAADAAGLSVVARRTTTHFLSAVKAALVAPAPSPA